MRVDAAPFSDERVRQALRLIADRQQMIDQALSGYGSLGNDMYAPFDPAYDEDLPQREQDLDQAKSLLKAAGQEDLQVELFTGDDIGSVATASASLFAEQAKEAGVDVKVDKKNPFYGDDYLSYPFAQDFWNTRLYIPQAGVCALKGGTYNETHWDDPKFNDLINDGPAARPTRPSAPSCCRTPSRSSTTRAATSSGASAGRSTAYPARCQGVEPSKYLPLGSYKFQYASV